jgi:hypothetical protein
MLIYTKKKTCKGWAKEVGRFFGFLQDGVLPVRFENVLPTPDSVSNGTYLLSRPLYLFTDGYPKIGSPLMKFCNFYLVFCKNAYLCRIRFVSSFFLLLFFIYQHPSWRKLDAYS